MEFEEINNIIIMMILKIQNFQFLISLKIVRQYDVNSEFD